MIGTLGGLMTKEDEIQEVKYYSGIGTYSSLADRFVGGRHLLYLFSPPWCLWRSQPQRPPRTSGEVRLQAGSRSHGPQNFGRLTILITTDHFTS